MSRSLQFSVFTNLRQASSFYTQAHSKNGVNISARLLVNAYLNLASRSGNDKSEAISLTAWGKAADILAWCLTKGKEFTAFCDLNVYQAPVYWNDQILTAPDGTQLMRKAYSYTIRRFDLGNDAFKHIMDEIQTGKRGQYWWVKGHQDAINFKATLDGRMAMVGHFDPQQHSTKFGFADVKMPKGAGIGAYIPNQPINTNAMPTAQPVGAATTPEAVAAVFNSNTQPIAAPSAAPVAGPVVAPTAAPVSPAASFVMPQGV